jgi:hypothetical protein
MDRRLRDEGKDGRTQSRYVEHHVVGRMRQVGQTMVRRSSAWRCGVLAVGEIFEK